MPNRTLITSYHQKSRGFTMVELVVILTILGLISAIAAPRFFSRNQFDAFGFAEQTRATLRFAQKSAIAKRRTVCVAINSNTVTLTFSSTFGGTCDTTLRNPADGSNFSQAAPSGIAISAASFNFSPLGQASAGQTIAITGGDVAQTMTIEAETGYVH